MQSSLQTLQTNLIQRGGRYDINHLPAQGKSSYPRSLHDVNSNIELFNLRVKNDVERLRARGETVDDLIMKIFKGCVCDLHRDEGRKLLGRIPSRFYQTNATSIKQVFDEKD